MRAAGCSVTGQRILEGRADEVAAYSCGAVTDNRRNPDAGLFGGKLSQEYPDIRMKPGLRPTGESAAGHVVQTDEPKGGVVRRVGTHLAGQAAVISGTAPLPRIAVVYGPVGSRGFHQPQDFMRIGLASCLSRIGHTIAIIGGRAMAKR